MSENERSSTFRQPFLALMASLAAFMAIFGVRIPEPKSTSEPPAKTDKAPDPTNATKARAEPTVVPLREWDDPFAELEQLLAQSKSSINHGEERLFDIQHGKKEEATQAIQSILKEKLVVDGPASPDNPNEKTSNRSRLLILVQIVSGPSHTNSKEARTLWGHAFRMALSGVGFNKCDEQSVACLECNIESATATSEALSRTTVLPMKLYESNGTSKGSKQYILNVWLMDEYLGSKPWLCMASVFQAIKSVIPADAVDQHPLSDRVSLAIVGPGGSGLLKGMDPSNDATKSFRKEPDANQESLKLLSFDLTKKPIHWINAHCTVPISPSESQHPAGQHLWKEKPDHWNGLIQYYASTPDDRELIGLLAEELRIRLTPTLNQLNSNAQRILVFHEDDSQFGQNLFESLQTELGPDFATIRIPYLRGIGLSTASSSKDKPTSKSTEVSDYFRRMIELYHARSGQLSSDNSQPIAIGILGGEVRDKIALLQEVRMRYPQALVFTNDLNVQYLDASTIPITRNLLIAAHAGLVALPTNDGENQNLLAFRDESQTTLWNGYQHLLTRVFDFPSTIEKNPRLAKLFEVGNSQFLEIATHVPPDGSSGLAPEGSGPKKSAVVAWTFTGVFRALLGGLCVLLVFGFPLLHAYCSENLRISRPILGWLERKILLPIASFFYRWFGVPFHLPFWFKDQATNIAKNAAIIIACVVVIVTCLAPWSLSECDWYNTASPNSGWKGLVAARDHLLNQTTTWFTGVSVLPSILLLTLCLPLTFWPAIKKDIERAFAEDTPRHPFTGHPVSNDSVDERSRVIRVAVAQIQASLSDSDQNGAEPGPTHDGMYACHSKNIRERIPFAIAYALAGSLAVSLRGWDDPWMMQIAVLAVVSSLLSSCPTVRIAVLISFLVGVAIAIAGWVFNDVAMVPARDAWVRSVGSCVFTVAYWWLLVGLVKLFVQQWRLRLLLREGTKTIDRICEDRLDFDRRAESERRLRFADQIMTETQSVSRIISRDLFQLSLVGLIICFARMPWFDAWGMSLATWLTIVVPMAAPFVSSIFLRRRGFEFRDVCLRYQTELSFGAATYGTSHSSGLPASRQANDVEKKELEDYGKRLTGWQSRFKSYDRGVFSPLDKDPMVSTGLSLLLAFSSGPQGDLFKRIATFLFI